ncbi:MAG: ABC transporter ATP-binding protein [Gemmatimonadetes bacterium]|nr:ABC transporter ATP-binding protein [Gemmatimonadota bacterium]
MLRLESLSKRFGETTAVSGLNLEVREGEFLSLLGPSGCGKTTTLRMIAGFERPDEGRILLADLDITRLPPQKRRAGMVFQSYALFPHLNVFENVAYGLRAQGPQPDLSARVSRALERVDLAGYQNRAVQALSGGQQQRVALARAMAPEPPLLLLDEPLSNLDAALRERTRVELRGLLKEFGITAVFVTHDQEEAFDLSDRIAILDHGLLQQVGSAEDLYHEPANAFVASFVGRANFLPARLISRDGERGICEIAGGVRWPATVRTDVREGAVELMIRPEALAFSDGSDSASGAALTGRILDRRFGGASTFFRIETTEGLELLVATGMAPAVIGDEVRVAPASDAKIHAFPVKQG